MKKISGGGDSSRSSDLVPYFSHIFDQKTEVGVLNLDQLGNNSRFKIEFKFSSRLFNGF